MCAGAWALATGRTGEVRVIWRLDDVNLPLVLLGVAATQVLLVVGVIGRRDDLDALIAATYAAAALVLRLLLTSRENRRIGEELRRVLAQRAGSIPSAGSCSGRCSGPRRTSARGSRPTCTTTPCKC